MKQYIGMYGRIKSKVARGCINTCAARGKKRNKRAGKYAGRGLMIPNRRDISERPTAETTKDAIIAALQPLKHSVYTITSDNGTESSQPTKTSQRV